MIKIKAQAWSIDVALAVIIFIAAFFVIYGLITGTTELPSLQQEAEIISKEATSENSSLSIVTNETLDETKIENILAQDYSEIKKKIRVENEFCIYFEDEEGNIIKIKDAQGIGSKDINISDVECG